MIRAVADTHTFIWHLARACYELSQAKSHMLNKAMKHENSKGQEM